MKKTGSYIASFILSILFIFTLIAAVGTLTVNKFLNADSMIALAKEKNCSTLVHNSLEKYFSERYSTSGIPADVYMDALDEEYLQNVINIRIKLGFDSLRNGDTIHDHSTDPTYILNSDLEQSISKFYNDYAESINYEKDAKFDEKLSSAKKSAYKIIMEYCDIFKFNSLSAHGVLQKLKPVYSRLPLLTVISVSASAFLALLLLLVNLKEKRSALYWLGISALISGAMGAVPCIYLISSSYFNSFTIKQPQIYTAYTSAMNLGTEKFMINSIIAACCGIVLVILYAIISKSKAKSEKDNSPDIQKN